MGIIAADFWRTPDHPLRRRAPGDGVDPKHEVARGMDAVLGGRAGPIG
jgi:hypothetical protein